jgi:hypothetical protein
MTRRTASGTTIVSRRRQRLRGPGRVPRGTGRCRAAVRDGAQAAPRDLGLRPRGARLPRRAHRDLAGRRGVPGLVGPDGVRRLVVATADPVTLPDKATWYLVTNLPRPGGPREKVSPWPTAGLGEVTRIYGLRHWAGAELQAGQGRARLGRLPGPLRHRHPPPPGPGQLRVHLLLAPPASPSSPGRQRTSLRHQAGPACCAPHWTPDLQPTAGTRTSGGPWQRPRT